MPNFIRTDVIAKDNESSFQRHNTTLERGWKSGDIFQCRQRTFISGHYHDLILCSGCKKLRLTGIYGFNRDQFFKPNIVGLGDRCNTLRNWQHQFTIFIPVFFSKASAP